LIDTDNGRSSPLLIGRRRLLLGQPRPKLSHQGVGPLAMGGCFLQKSARILGRISSQPIGDSPIEEFGENSTLKCEFAYGKLKVKQTCWDFHQKNSMAANSRLG
jgi:hypothetical protein